MGSRGASGGSGSGGAGAAGSGTRAPLEVTLLRHIEEDGEGEGGEEGHRGSGSSSRKKPRLLSAAAPSVLGALLASPLGLL